MTEEQYEDFKSKMLDYFTNDEKTASYVYTELLKILALKKKKR